MNESQYDDSPTPSQANQTEATRLKRARRRPTIVTISLAASLALSLAAGVGLARSGRSVDPDERSMSGIVNQHPAMRTVPEEQIEGRSPFAGSDSEDRAQVPSDPGNNSVPGHGGNDAGSSEEDLDTEPATQSESTGVVFIESELKHQGSAAAGTGLVLEDDGTILTNYHVIADSTSISVTDATSGQTYDATVVGTDSDQDLAVLQIHPETELEPVSVADDDVAVGDEVTAVGNSGGAGELQAADGTVTATEATVTTAAEANLESESLDNMIEVDADIVSGDSGGPLLNEEGDVVGIDTAASQGSADITGYAIDIDDAIDMAREISDGIRTSTNTIGYPAFLGISIEASQTPTAAEGASPNSSGSNRSSRRYRSESSSVASGAAIAGVYENTPASDAGIQAGDTITSIDSTEVTDGQHLAELLEEHSPTEQVELTWTDTNGQTNTTTVTLIEGPA